MKKPLVFLALILFSIHLKAQYSLRHSQDIRDFYVQSHFVKLNLTAGIGRNINALYEIGFANRFSLELGGAYMIPSKLLNKYLNNEIKLDLDGKELTPLQTSNFSGFSGMVGINFFLDRSAGFDNEGWFVGIFGKYMQYQFNVATIDESDKTTRLNKATTHIWLPGFQTGYKYVFNSGLFTEIFLGVGQGLGYVAYKIENVEKPKNVSFNRPLPRGGLRLGYKF
jgi:Protein of unknown function (DUF3575)